MSESLAEKQQELVTQNHKLIYWFANKNNLEVDEYYDILAIGLCKAAMIYDENKSKFSTIACHCMKNEVMAHWKHIKRDKIIPEALILSYDKQNKTEDGDNGDCFLNCITDNYSVCEAVTIKIMFTNFIDTLTEVEKDIVKYLVDEVNQVDIAVKMNCSRQNINEYVKRIRKKFKNYFYN